MVETATDLAFELAPDSPERRIDVALAELLAGELSRSRLQSIIKAGGVTLNGTPVLDVKRTVRAGDMLALAMPDLEDPVPAPEAIALAVLYEDDDLIVIDKPAGMTVHPGAGIRSGTLVNALLHHCAGSLSGIGGVARPGIVHRLDKETSGVMVVAKHDKAHRGLADQFADHGRTTELERVYRALVWGVPHPPVGLVDAALGRSNSDRTKRAVVSETRNDARHAVTHYRIRERFGEPGIASELECRLETGRTHQIRVHMAHVGLPLIGDQVYGAHFATKAPALGGAVAETVAALGRQALHAASLAFEHPVTGQHMAFETDPPADYEAVRAALTQL